MGKNSCILVFIFLYLYISGCKKSSEITPDNYFEPAMDKVLRDYPGAKVTVIDLDSIEPTPIKSEDHKIISDSVSPKGKLFFSSPWAGTSFNGNIYLTDYQQNCLFELKDGVIRRKIGRAGAAPLEFKEPYNIASNDSMLFIEDHGNGRIQVLAKNLNYIFSIPSSFIYFAGDISASNNRLFITENNPSSALVNVFWINHNQLKYITSIVPVIVVPPKQPFGVNALTFSVSSDSNFYFAYKTLPYILVYDSEYKLKSIFELSGKDIEKIKSEKPAVLNGVKFIIRDIKITKDNKYIYVLLGSTLIALKKTDSELKISKKYSLTNQPFKIAVDSSSVYLFDSFKARVDIIPN